ncbi:cupin domain-containing protein [Wenjunlia tyrosinilytica]|uniref:cupin domain-containing protein n=1 Tax=Wenjunlia tyrosinilytica TaxID=1544741 RepID=UPI00166A0345|nr:cupin domain-containing protein [Wenjunlia tyrosinilytica]
MGYGITEDRHRAPRLADPHGFSLAWPRAEPGKGVCTHCHDESQVLIVTQGRWRITLNRADPVTTEVGPYDTVSIPPGSWRRFESIGEERAQAVVLTGGEGRTRLTWEPGVVAAAREWGAVVDAKAMSPTRLKSVEVRIWRRVGQQSTTAPVDRDAVVWVLPTSMPARIAAMWCLRAVSCWPLRADDLAVESLRCDHSQFLIGSRVVVERRAANPWKPQAAAVRKPHPTPLVSQPYGGLARPREDRGEVRSNHLPDSPTWAIPVP